MKKYLTNILKIDTSGDDKKEKVDHWLDSFEKFHKKYMIMPIESLNSSFPEESRYIVLRSQPGFIIQENETICHFNATIQLLYCKCSFQTIDNQHLLLCHDY